MDILQDNPPRVNYAVLYLAVCHLLMNLSVAELI